MYAALFGKLDETNLVTLLMSLTIVAALELYAQLLERRLTRLLRGVSFPAHLFVVAIGILVSHFAGLERRHSVRVVGHVKSGMPSPEPPPFELLPKVASNGCIVAVVSYVVSYSLGTQFLLLNFRIYLAFSPICSDPNGEPAQVQDPSQPGASGKRVRDVTKLRKIVSRGYTVEIC